MWECDIGTERVALPSSSRPAKAPRLTKSACSAAGPSPTWVQCDRCSKWRLLVGAAVDEDAPWFCEMSADTTANWCDAPEVSACRDVDPSINEDLYFVQRIMAERNRAGYRREFLVRWLGWGAEHDSWEPDVNIADRSLIDEFTETNACVTTTTNIRPCTWAFVGTCPNLHERGLFARADLRREQAICEYGGPRLPSALQVGSGMYVLQVPKTRIIIDGGCDNLPGEYDVPRYAAIFANHSAVPNARLEYWPDIFARDTELSGAMWIVATEDIAAGAEIRINYEAGEAHEYWTHGAPKENAQWRDVRLPISGPPVPCGTVAAIGVLDAIREAASTRRGALARPRLTPALDLGLEQAACGPTVPLSERRADQRIAELAPLLARADNRKTWGLLATHVPGWSGRQCYDRWVGRGRQPRLQDQQEELQLTADGRQRSKAAVAKTILRTMQ